MLRVVVNPLFSKAVECIRHQIPVLSSFSQFPTETRETQQGKRRWREIRPQDEPIAGNFIGGYGHNGCALRAGREQKGTQSKGLVEVS
jgi:hypothetical protein